jgi:excisionase family DNA binding protein
MSTHPIPESEKLTQECMTVTVEEAGRMLGIGRGTAYQAAKSGEIPTIRIGTRLLVPRAQINRMLGLENSESPAGQPDSREDTARARRDASG